MYVPSHEKGMEDTTSFAQSVKCLRVLSIGAACPICILLSTLAHTPPSFFPVRKTTLLSRQASSNGARQNADIRMMRFFRLSEDETAASNSFSVPFPSDETIAGKCRQGRGVGIQPRSICQLRKKKKAWFRTEFWT